MTLQGDAMPFNQKCSFGRVKVVYVLSYAQSAAIHFGWQPCL